MTPDDMSPLLLVMLLIPLLGGLGLALLPRHFDRFAQWGAAFFALANLAVSLVVAWGFDWANPDIQFYQSLPWVQGLALTFNYGIDAISLWLVLLTTLVGALAIIGSFNSVTHRVREFYVWLLLLEAALIGAFIARDVIFFYICFEFTLLPIYFLLGVHGGKDRLRAARLYFIYTFAGSLLTLTGILYLAWWNWTLTTVWSFGFAQLTAAAQAMTFTQQMWIFLAMLAGFAVKVPLFPLHTWQPIAYSQSPTAATMLLAGVLLKMATYALVRLAIPFAPLAAVELAPIIGVLAIVGILYAGLISWVQTDLKKLIAYSSMSHMGFCVLGMFALNLIGLTGSVAYMVNHGLSTAALFLCVGMIQQRFGTRKLTDLGGLARVMPVWAFFMVFFVFVSVGLPGLNGFVGEFLTLLGAFTQPQLLGPRYAAFAALGMILSAMYLLYMTSRLVFGRLLLPDGSQGVPAVAPAQVRDLGMREVAVLVPLAAGCLWLGLYPQPLLRTIEAPLQQVAQVTTQALASRASHMQGDDAGDGLNAADSSRPYYQADPLFQAGTAHGKPAYSSDHKRMNPQSNEADDNAAAQPHDGQSRSRNATGSETDQ